MYAATQLTRRRCHFRRGQTTFFHEHGIVYVNQHVLEQESDRKQVSNEAMTM